MKRVVNSQQVAHLFANQSQDNARNAAQSMSFSEDVAYSYQTPVARILNLPPSIRVMLLTAEKYSNTTAHHLHHYWRAFDGPVFRVPSLGVCGGRHWERSGSRDVDHAYNLAHLVKVAEDEIARLSRMRSRPFATDWVREMCRIADKYARLFGLTGPRTLADWTAEIESALAKTVARVERAEARYNTPEAIAERARFDAERVERDRLHREQRAIELADEMIRWRAGEDVRLPYDAPTILRLRHDRVQTSHGAEVTERNARLLYDAILAGREVAGYKLDGFEVRSVSDVLVIGCHQIPMAEVHRFAQQRGW